MGHVSASTDRGGGSALHHAVARRHLAAAEALLDAGADPGCENAAGYTPTDLATTGGATKVLRCLEQRAEFRGLLVVKVPVLGGLGREWQRRWVTVYQRRRAMPGGGRSFLGGVLVVYASEGAPTPACTVWLTGATAVSMRTACAGCVCVDATGV